MDQQLTSVSHVPPVIAPDSVIDIVILDGIDVCEEGTHAPFVVALAGVEDGVFGSAYV
jgi:hypothetical protein